jgi:NAD(P)-dependent dehydrogenase (short-subunit alcohol dehydrogenase family)
MQSRNGDTNRQSNPARPALTSRRDLFRTGGAVVAGTLAGAIATTAEASQAPPFETRVFPVYFPLAGFTPDIDLTGKFAVITGASRGIGRATAEALVARGATVIGTSRDVGGVPNPPSSFELLDLDITSDASVNAFVSALLAHPAYPGRIDILINNAGRYVIGTITPPPIGPDPAGFFMQQSEIGVETLYKGHMRVTNRLLPHMSQAGYSRLLFTVSSNAYFVGGSPAEAVFADGILSFQNVYTSAKRALLAYASNLRGFLRASGSAIKVSTVNPYAIRTTLAEGLNPVYTEPVDGNGNSPWNPFLQAVLDGVRASLQNALPASFVGATYAQLLSMSDPYPNVAVASPSDPVTAAGVAFFNDVVKAENEEAALRLGSAPPGRR